MSKTRKVAYSSIASEIVLHKDQYKICIGLRIKDTIVFLLKA